MIEALLIPLVAALGAVFFCVCLHATIEHSRDRHGVPRLDRERSMEDEP